MAGQTISVTVLANTRQFARSMQGLGNSSGIKKLGAQFKTAGKAVEGFLASGAAAGGAAVAGFGAVAGAAGGALAAVVGLGVGMAAQNKKVQKSFAGLKKDVVGGLTKAVKPLVPVLTGVAKDLGKLFDKIEPSLSKIFKELAPLLDKFAGKAVKAIGKLIPPFLQLVRAAMPLIDVLGDALMPIVNALAPILKTMAGIVKKDLVPVFKQIVGVVVQLLPFIGDLLTSLAKVGGQILQALLPALKSIFKALTPLLPVFAKLIKSLAPILPMIAKLAAQLIEMLVPVLAPLIKLIAQVAGVFGKALMKAFKALMPALKSIIKSVLTLLPALMPLIPAVLGVVTAVLPLIPAIVKLAALLLNALMPVLLPLITALVKVATVILGKVAKALTWLVDKFTKAIVPATDKVRTAMIKTKDGITTAWDAVKKALGIAWDWIKKHVVDPWKTVFTKSIPGAMDTMRSKAIGAIRVVVNSFLTMVGKIIKGAAHAFGWVPGLGGKLKSAAKNFTSFRQKVNAELAKIQNKHVSVKLTTSGFKSAVGLLGGPKVTRAQANGGTVTGAPRRPYGDKVLTWLAPGEEVISNRNGQADKHRALLKAINSGKQINGLAGGGTVFAMNTSGLDTAAAQFKQLRVSMNAMTSQLTSWASKAFSGIFGTGSSGGGYGSGVARWRGTAIAAMKAAGLPLRYLNLLLHRMQVESGGNPRAINLWDSNAAHGDPSRGLMQTIGSTFNAYAGRYRGLGIYNPFANIYAAIRYTLARYGLSGLVGAWSGTHGYATGVGSASGGWAWVGERGPELMRVPAGSRILNHKKSEAVATATKLSREDIEALGDYIGQKVLEGSYAGTYGGSARRDADLAQASRIYARSRPGGGD